MSSWDPTDAAVLSDAPSLHLTVGSEVVELGMVVVDGSLYVRAFRGPASRWYRAALTDPAGRIRVGPLDRAVSLAPHPEPSTPPTAPNTAPSSTTPRLAGPPCA